MKQGLEGFDLFSVKQNLSAYKEGKSYKSLYYTGKKNAQFLKQLHYIDKIPKLDSLLDSSFIQTYTKN